MWILKNSNELLEHLKSPNFNNITSIKSFVFSTLYTTIPHDKLKSRLASIIWNSFMFKNGNRRYKYLVLGQEESYFVKEHSDSIFMGFAGKVFQQIVGIPMGRNCAPLLADIFLYSYDAELIQSLLSTGRTTFNVSVQLHIQVHRWCFVHKQPRVWELPGPDVSRWTRNQRHDREQHLCFLLEFTSVDREGR